MKKRSGFKMRSGNTSSFKMIGSSSPMKDKDPTAMEAYQSGTTAIQNAVNSGATSAEIREMVVKHNSSVRGMKNAGKAKINYNTVKGYKPEKPIVKEEKTFVVPSKRPVEPKAPKKKGKGWQVTIGNVTAGVGERFENKTK